MVRVEIVPEEGRTIKEEAVKEVRDFEAWFMQYLKNGEPLTRFEKALLNDYLGWKSGQVVQG